MRRRSNLLSTIIFELTIICEEKEELEGSRREGGGE